MKSINNKRLVLALTVPAMCFLLISAVAQEEYTYVAQWTHALFNAPYGIGIDSQDNIYVPGTNSNCILKFTPDGDLMAVWGSQGADPGQFDIPISVAFDSDDNVYIYDWGNARIQKFSPTGSFITKWGSSGSGDGQFGWGWGSIAIDNVNNVYLVDGANNRIQKFTSDGGFITKWGSYGNEPGQLNWPTGITVDSDNNVYVVDNGNNRIQKFTDTGSYILEWGSYGSDDGQFSWPWGSMAVDSYNNVFVADPENHRIQKFTSNGTFITKWGSFGSGDGQFIYPTDIAINSSGFAFVVDGDNDRIQKFAPPASSTGNISGNVTTNSNGLADIIVKLLDNQDPTVIIGEIVTDSQGNYLFSEIPAGNYQVMIVEPLGYSADQNFVVINLNPGTNAITNFIMIQTVLSNEARSKGYWKHQFDVYALNRGNAQESEQDLLSYMAEVEIHYNTHFNIFNGIDDFEKWQAILSIKGNAGMGDRARSQVAALLLNIVSLKIAQYEVVTTDNKTAGDVLTFTSELIEDGVGSNDELAKDLAEQVNLRQIIPAGLVDPSQSILYKGGKDQSLIDWDAGFPLEFALHQNYPNPFNPTTTIKFAIPEQTHVSLKVYDALGREVLTPVNENLPKGIYTINFDASKLTSGIYIYQIMAKNFVDTKKMLLIR